MIEIEGFGWISDQLFNQIVATGGEIPPNTLYGIPVVMQEADCHNGNQDAVSATQVDLTEPNLQCPATQAALIRYGTTPKGACPPIVTHRSKRCPCGKLHPNGKYRAFKNCCGQ